jgi:transcription initiation factor TFIIF subunit beta
LKNDGKRLRDSKESVMEKLFAAFEKHQYYNVKDLVRVTNQPIVSYTFFSFEATLQN